MIELNHYQLIGNVLDCNLSYLIFQVINLRNILPYPLQSNLVISLLSLSQMIFLVKCTRQFLKPFDFLKLKILYWHSHAFQILLDLLMLVMFLYIIYNFKFPHQLECNKYPIRRIWFFLQYDLPNISLKQQLNIFYPNHQLLSHHN